MRPLVIAYHIIWTVYGWWLPNDPRGSGSRTVASDTIAKLGEVHFGRKRIQPASSDVRAFYEQATRVLNHPLLEVTPEALSIVADAFGEVIAREKYTCYACAIMPDHVHLVIRKHKHTVEEMIGLLQNESRWVLIDKNLRPSDHPVWTGGDGWSVFLGHPDDVERTVTYIEANPRKAGMADQHWPFVSAYDRWPLHDGHSERSPYVKRLKALGRYP